MVSREKDWRILFFEMLVLGKKLEHTREDVQVGMEDRCWCLWLGF